MIDYKELVEELRDADQANWKRLSLDAAAAIEALQANVKRLKEANDELREAQTYIDHYGDKWMTSAKDVPTAAYEHGYMDGKNEAEQALEPKRGDHLDSQPPEVWDRAHENMRGYFKAAKNKMEVQE